MDSTELLQVFRDEVSDVEPEYLWSDAEFYRYLDDAQKMFCRLTQGLEDSRTRAVTQLTIVPGEEWYSLSPLVLQIRRASRSDSGRPVAVVAMERMEENDIRFDGRVGPLRALVTGLESGAVRAWPVPNEAATVELSVFRLPLRTINAEGQRLEIDEHHHLALLDWVKHKAYGKHDSETYAPALSQGYEQSFRRYCAAVTTEQTRRRRPVGTTAYGGL